MGPTSATSFSSEGKPMALPRKLDLADLCVRRVPLHSDRVCWFRDCCCHRPDCSSPNLPAPAKTPPAEPEGVTSGGYQIHSSIELGYRFNNITGSDDMYDTLGESADRPAFSRPDAFDAIARSPGPAVRQSLPQQLWLGRRPQQRPAASGGQEQVVQPPRQFPSRSEFL